MTYARVCLVFGLVAALEACAPATPSGASPAPAGTAAARPSPPQASASPSECALVDPDARNSLETLQRLGMITTCQEEKGGVLRLEQGPGWSRAPAEHHLNHLFNGYYQQLPDHKPVIELWKNGQRVGVYTIDGLVYGAERASPQ